MTTPTRIRRREESPDIEDLRPYSRRHIETGDAPMGYSYASSIESLYEINTHKVGSTEIDQVFGQFEYNDTYFSGERMTYSSSHKSYFFRDFPGDPKQKMRFS